MLRLRRYRVYLAAAVIALFLLYRVTHDTDWEALAGPIDYSASTKPKTAVKPASHDTPADNIAGRLGFHRKRPQQLQKPLGSENKEGLTVKLPDLTNKDDSKPIDYTLPTTTLKTPKVQPTAIDVTKVTGVNASDVPVVLIPDRITPHQLWQEQAEKEKIEKERLAALKKHQGSEQGLKTSTKTTATSTVHWSRPTEVFPIATASIITLPTGVPKAIPKIQHIFKAESEEARERRVERLAIVKGEMKRAWTGYKTYAWMHDELSPVTQKFRDPFCGWAATLVDALDTLWIMDMKEEFEEAVKAVAHIDFTTASRTEIPVFETTIRYLGGLLAAYDVSGGKAGDHEILLEKAIELAEILMGIFDTPNRMPILYYNWKPAFMGKPRRAATSVSVAELGSLLMEFTRLAQLTNDNKYYDAVARITNAFEDWQTRPNGTTIPGIFPEHVDASGCNRTAARDAELKLSQEQTAKVQSVLDASDDYTGREYSHKSSKAGAAAKMSAAVDTNTMPDLGLADKTDRLGGKAQSPRGKRSDFDVDEDLYDHPLTLDIDSTSPKKELTAPQASSAPDLYEHMMLGKVTEAAYTLPELAEVCYPQGLTSGGWARDSYSMGGSQDSTYEYFPKQFLLLGGLDTKYQVMHSKVADAVKKWLLYRPMVPDNRDILFSAKISTAGKPELDLLSEYEVTHLTCFLGGMFAMAGKIFEEPVDVEIGRKLTDGCVWAYEMMPTGIMPEAATVVPCADASSCPWNETLWHQYLDPLWSTRERQIDDFYKRKAEKKVQNEAKKQADLLFEAATELDDISEQAVKPPAFVDPADVAEFQEEMSNMDATPADPVPEIKKRGLDIDATEQLETSSNDNSPPTRKAKPIILEDSIGGKDILIAGGGARVGKPFRGGTAQTPLVDDEDRAQPDPVRPLTHEEYVASRIKNEGIPPGFVSIQSKHYILR